MSIDARLGLNVFKEEGEFPIKINPDKANDPGLLACVRLCPASLYNLDEDGVVVLSTDGCLECGTCKIICGNQVLSWTYPEGASGVQFRFG